MKFIIYSCVFYCHFVYADSICQNVFVGLESKKVVEVLPSALDSLTFSTHLKAKIDQHPKVQLLRKKYNQGESLKSLFFVRDQLLKSDVKTGGLLLGENLQSRFLMSVMKYIFPMLYIKFDDRKNEDSKRAKSIRFVVKDFYENLPLDHANINRQRLKKDYFFFDMNLLKIVNHSFRHINKDYKKYFTSFEKQKTISLYLHKHSISTALLESVVHSLTQEGFNRIFIHIPYDRHNIQLDFVTTVDIDSKTTIKDIHHFKPTENVVFMNETQGYVSAFHSLSEYVLVLGPINLLEGLHLGVKTIFLKHKPPEHIPVSVAEKTQNYYQYSSHKDMIKSAEYSNRFVEIDRASEIPQALKNLKDLSQKPMFYPEDAIANPSTGESYFDQFIERIYQNVIEVPKS